MNHPMHLHTSPQRRPAVRRAARYAAFCAAFCAALCAAPAAQATSSDPYVGELMVFGGGFCPLGWLPADGRQLDISGYEVLFLLLNTSYGGNGVTTFGLPDLRGRSAVGLGNGPGLAPQAQGQQGGRETATLQPQNLPPHIHQLPASTQSATHATPAPGRVPAAAQNGGAYASASANVNLQAASAAPGSQPFSVRGPFVAMQWCIAVEGIYPSPY